MSISKQDQNPWFITLSDTISISKLFIKQYPVVTYSFCLASHGARDIDNVASANADY